MGIQSTGTLGHNVTSSGRQAHTPTGKHARLTRHAAVVTVLAAITITGCGATSTPPDRMTPSTPTAAKTETAATTMTVSGTVSFSCTSADECSTDANENICIGVGGYSDLSQDTSVEITDASGTTVGLGHVLYSELHDTTCELRFSAEDIPTGAGFYGIEISHRGIVKFAEADLASPVTLTIG